jgi:hypothetical protein
MPRAQREFKRASKTNYTFDFEEGKGHDLLDGRIFLTIDAWLKRRVTGGTSGEATAEDKAGAGGASGGKP